MNDDFFVTNKVKWLLTTEVAEAASRSWRSGQSRKRRAGAKSGFGNHKGGNVNDDFFVTNKVKWLLTTEVAETASRSWRSGQSRKRRVGAKSGFGNHKREM